MTHAKFHEKKPACPDGCHSNLWIGLGITALFGIAGSLFFLPKRSFRTPGKKINIDIRYDIPIDADATFLAQNLVKIIKIILTPLQSKINREGATLILVFGDNSWEMRVRNGSDNLRKSMRKLLESREW